MANKNKDLIDQKLQDLNNDGVDRRGFLKCMAWAGTGLVWTLSGGVPRTLQPLMQSRRPDATILRQDCRA